MSLSAKNWSAIPEKLCFAACPEDVPCECRERAESNGLDYINIYDQEIIERLRSKAESADDSSNWITLTGMTDEQIREALFSKE